MSDSDEEGELDSMMKAMIPVPPMFSTGIENAPVFRLNLEGKRDNTAKGWKTATNAFATFITYGKTVSWPASMQFVAATAWSAPSSVPNGRRALADQVYEKIEHEIVENNKPSKPMHTLKSNLQAMLSRVLADHFEGQMKGV